MTNDRWMRASDQDRENAVDVLRDAYAVGRLRPEEFYQRLDAAYAAMTWGELDNLIADLPPVWTDADLPSDIVASCGSSGTAGQSFFWQAIWVNAVCVFLLMLVAALADRVTSAAVWAACVLVPCVLLLPLALERISRALGYTRRDGRQRELRASSSTNWRR